MNNFRIGQIVYRTDSQAYGMYGTVVEIAATGRTRVKWDLGERNLRTWVKPTILTATEITDEMISNYRKTWTGERRVAKVAAPVARKIEKPIDLTPADYQVHFMPDQNTCEVRRTSDGAVILPKSLGLTFSGAMYYCGKINDSKVPERRIAQILVEILASENANA
jgi:hypothetical protein